MIDGNLTIELQKNTGTTKNEIGEVVQTWETIHTLTGWLDLSGGDSKRTSYDTKIQESTHVFVCDYVQLDSGIKPENSRLTFGGLFYDVMLIDDPMNLHQQLEIFLKFTGV